MIKIGISALSQVTITKQVFKLALPFIISNIIVPLLGIIDLTIVGHMGDVTCIGAIATGTMIFNVLYWFSSFLRMGISGMTFQALGRRDLIEAMGSLVRSLTVSTAIAAIFIVFQLPIRWMALPIMQPTEQTAEQAAVYSSFCIWGTPAMLGLYGLTGWFIGMQDMRIPMLVSIFQNIVNIVASMTFVFGFGMKIQDVVLGTLTVQRTGFLPVLHCWKWYYDRLAGYNWKDDLFKRSTMVRFFAFNRDIFIRTLFLIDVNLLFIPAGPRQGAIILSASTPLMTSLTLFSYVMDGLAYVGKALSGKYHSAASKLTFDRVYNSLSAWGAITAVMFTLVYTVGGNGFLMLLTNEVVVVQSAEAYSWWVAMIPIVNVSTFVYDGIFIGLTATRGMLVSSVVPALVFFALYFVLQTHLGSRALRLVFIVYLGLRGGMQWFLYRRMYLNWVQK